jgi:hypothetical protein
MDIQRIINIWKESGYPGINKLNKIIKNKNIDIDIDDVKKIIEKQYTYQIHKKKNHNIKGRIVSHYPYDKVQADLLDMSKFSRKNGGYRWIFMLVDIFTRKAFIVPLKNKMASSVLDAIKTLHKTVQFKIIETDDGSEYKENVKKFFKDNNILHKIYSANIDHFPLSIINNFSKLLKNTLYRHFTNENSTNWINYIETFMKNYNNTPNSAIDDIVPNEATTLENFEKISEINREKDNDDYDENENFKIGDTVRIHNDKNVFTRGYTPKWSDETYKIVSKNKTHATLNNNQRVRLENIQIIKDINKNANKSSVEALKEALKDEKVIRKTKREGIFDELNEEDILSFSKFFKTGKSINLFSEPLLYNMSLEWGSAVIHIPSKMWVQNQYGSWKLVNTTTKTGQLSIRDGKYCVRFVPIDDKLEITNEGIIYQNSRQGRKMAKTRKKKEKKDGDNDEGDKKGKKSTKDKKRKKRDEVEDERLLIEGTRPSDLDVDGEGIKSRNKFKGKGFNDDKLIFSNKKQEKINRIRFLA